MCNKEHLVGYLYDELSAADRESVRGAHRRTARSAATKSRSFCDDARSTSRLGRRRSPNSTFTVVQSARDGRSAEAVAGRSCRSGDAGRCRRGVLVLAGAAAIANLEVRYGPAMGVSSCGPGWSARPRPDAAGCAGRRGPDRLCARRRRRQNELNGRLAALEAG